MPEPVNPLPQRGASRVPGGAPLIVGFAVMAGVAAVAVMILARAGREDEGGEFDFDIQALLAVDPSLIVCEESGSFDVPFEEPRGLIVLGSGKLAVVGDAALRTFKASGDPLDELALEGEPRCVAERPDGALLIGFQDHVEVYETARWSRTAVWESLGAKALLVSIAPAGEWVYVADAGQRVVWRCDPAGKPVGSLGKRDSERGIPGIVLPSPHLDIALAPDGLLRVANPGRHRIEAYTPRGDLELHWGKPSMAIEGFSGCCNPCSFALLPDGGFVTCEKGLPRVKIYDSQGGFVGVVAGPMEFAEGELALEGDWRQGSGGGLDVAVDGAGTIFVLDPIARRVISFVRSKGS